jgi:hypothetical protein
MAKEVKNYTLGRGKLDFALFKPGTQTPDGFLYFGNTPEFNLTITADDLDHFSSDEGVKEKDDGVTLQVTRTGTMITDNIAPDNIALFFFGAASTIVTATAGTTTTTIEGVKQGYKYIVGATDDNPAGVRGINPAGFEISDSAGTRSHATVTITAAPTADDTVVVNGHTYKFVAAVAAANDVAIGGNVATAAANLAAAINAAGNGNGTAYGPGTVANADASAVSAAGVVTLTALSSGVGGNALTLTKTGAAITVSGATFTGGSASAGTYVVTEDYLINFDTGELLIVDGGAIPDATDLEVTFATRASTRDRVLSGTSAIEGALRYTSFNPKGKQFDYYMGYVQITPNGDYSLKGDEWQQIPFNLQILKPNNGMAAIIMDGRPVYQ